MRREELKKLWDVDPRAFVARLRQVYDRVVLDWGFPVRCLPWIEELQALDIKLIWFDGDIAQARKQFENRKMKGTVQDFDRQVKEIRKAGFPENLRDYTLVGQWKVPWHLRY